MLFVFSFLSYYFYISSLLSKLVIFGKLDNRGSCFPGWFALRTKRPKYRGRHPQYSVD